MATTRPTAPAITSHFQRRLQATTGSYHAIRMRLSGCFSSEWILPTSTPFTSEASQRGRRRKFSLRKNSSRMAGSSVMASTAATIMEKFLV